jgi:putative Ca2+/H+ antiporter (TMEM165/GDT1 family)
MPGKAHSNRAIIASFLSRALHLCSLEAFLTSTVLVVLAEIGDKTQLLSFALAAKLRRPYPIMAGILVATLLNHALAATAGAWLASLISPQFLNWIIALSFIGFALWTLKPDVLDKEPHIFDSGIFLTTLIAFFMAEMGEKRSLQPWRWRRAMIRYMPLYWGPPSV